MKKNLIIASALVIVVLIAGFIWLNHKHNLKLSLSSFLPSSGSTNSPTPTPSGKVNSGAGAGSNPSQTQKDLNGGFDLPSVDYNKLTGPASCQVAGSINFVSASSAITSNNVLTYKGIDSPARQIYWTVSPNDKLNVGPNIDASLKIPDGSSPIQVVLPDNPQAKHYTLTAAMTYGRLVNGGVRVFTVQCSGQVKVDLNY